MGAAKFCRMPKAITVKKKNTKHIHTTGTPRNANVPPPRVFPSTTASGASSRSARLKSRNASAATPTIAAAIPEARHPHAPATAIMSTGAAAHPRLPESPCTENACPSRGADTRRLRSVKSAGWNTQLPSPATIAAASSIGKFCAEASTRPEAESSAIPPASTRSAPKRSTTKPAIACPTPETTKNTVIVRPTCVNDSPNSAMSHGKSGGIMKWKKCEVPCAKPTSEITAASWRKGVAGEAVDMGGGEIRAGRPILSR